MKRIYLDYAATTPVDKEVLARMEPHFYLKYGNPGSIHSFGQEAIAAVDLSREIIFHAIGADFREIIFTGSATEANNLALRGTLKTFQNSIVKNPRLIVSRIEHESVLETARVLENEGVDVIYLPVSKDGFVNIEDFKNVLNEQTILVSVMYANNEIGTIQPIQEISKIIADFKKEHKTAYPFFHTDAVQAFQYFNCNPNDLGVDLMTLSAHKIYGPKGIGALYVRNIDKLKPIITGGGQEFGLRSGTENVPSIVGFGKAVELVTRLREKESERITELKNYFWTEIKKVFSKSELNGGGPKLPNILNIYFPGEKAEDLLIKLDMAGIAVSSGPACSSRALKPSHVLEAMGFGEERIKSSLRFSFGKFINKKEINEAIKRIAKILTK